MEAMVPWAFNSEGINMAFTWNHGIGVDTVMIERWVSGHDFSNGVLVNVVPSDKLHILLSRFTSIIAFIIKMITVCLNKEPFSILDIKPILMSSTEIVS